MNPKPIVHGSFTIERTYRASPTRVFAAWADIETKARWFVGPPERWSLLERRLDLRVGGTELLVGQLANGPTTRFVARYHEIVPDRRLVYVYDMHVGDSFMSTSLATVELDRTASGGTRMTFTEQAAFLDGQDGTRSRDEGTAAHFDRMAPVLEDPRETVHSRVIEATPAQVFAAFRSPDELSRWWGPKGFRSDIETLELVTGGRWKFLFHGPDGKTYPNDNRFAEVLPDERVVVRHADPGHDFTLTIGLVDLGDRTLVTWRQRFDDPAVLAAVREMVMPANEENLERLADVIAAR